MSTVLIGSLLAPQQQRRGGDRREHRRRQEQVGIDASHGRGEARSRIQLVAHRVRIAQERQVPGDRLLGEVATLERACETGLPQDHAYGPFVRWDRREDAPEDAHVHQSHHERDSGHRHAGRPAVHDEAFDTFRVRGGGPQREVAAERCREDVRGIERERVEDIDDQRVGEGFEARDVVEPCRDAVTETAARSVQEDAPEARHPRDQLRPAGTGIGHAVHQDDRRAVTRLLHAHRDTGAFEVQPLLGRHHINRTPQALLGVPKSSFVHRRRSRMRRISGTT